MRLRRVVVGTAVLVTLSAVLAFFAQDHRPFSGTDHPFVYAYLGILGLLAALIALAWWLVRP